MARKSKTPPTFEERLNAASAQSEAAVSVFEAIASDLELAARDKRDIAADITFEVDRLEQLIEELMGLRAVAETAAKVNETKATNVRALVGN